MHDVPHRYAVFTLRTDCVRCGEHVPVNGFAEASSCSACGHRFDIRDDMYTGLLETFEEERPEQERAGVTIAGQQYHWTMRAVPKPEGWDAAAIHPVPTGVREKCVTATAFMGSLAPTPVDAEPEPVALTCPQCGAGLTLSTERERLTRCDYCDGQIQIPESVWQALHPPSVVEPWTVRFEGLTKRERKRQKKQKKAAKKREAEARPVREAPAIEAPKPGASTMRVLLFALVGLAVLAVPVLVGFALVFGLALL